MKTTYGYENGLTPGTGNHKGCPYDEFVGAMFIAKKEADHAATMV